MTTSTPSSSRPIISDEIGKGEGANLVIARDYLAHIEDWDRAKALGVFTRLLRQERGAYWTFLVFTGDRYLVGASPERHVRVQARRGLDEPDQRHVPAGTAAAGDLADRLLRFLGDEKEIFELFMVVDEELKMMCGMCSGGGSITGPFLKPMSHLIHTEYLLSGPVLARRARRAARTRCSPRRSPAARSRTPAG